MNRKHTSYYRFIEGPDGHLRTERVNWFQAQRWRFLFWARSGSTVKKVMAFIDKPCIGDYPECHD